MKGKITTAIFLVFTVLILLEKLSKETLTAWDKLMLIFIGFIFGLFAVLIMIWIHDITEKKEGHSR